MVKDLQSSTFVDWQRLRVQENSSEIPSVRAQPLKVDNYSSVFVWLTVGIHAKNNGPGRAQQHG